MKNVFVLILVLFSTLTIYAQGAKKDPRGYFKNFQSETRRISRKNYIYLEASIKGSDPARVQRYREMVVEQLKDSKKSVERLSNFGEDDILKREYEDALNMYLKAFTKQFKDADSLNAFKFNSFKDLMLFHTTIGEAEQTMIDATYKIKKAEEYFAKKYGVNVRRDEKAEEEYKMLDEVTLYARDMTQAFFRVDDQSQRFITIAARNNTDSLSLVVSDMRKAIDLSKNEVESYSDNLMNNDLQKEVSYYLEDMRDQIGVQLVQLADDLNNPYMEEKEFKRAKKELENFIYQTNKYREDFFDTRQGLIEDYLPSK